MKQKEFFVALRSKSEIGGIFNQGTKLYSRNFLLRYQSRDDSGQLLPFHVLTALSKKQLGAVKRNRLKRICKSALFQAMNNLHELLSAYPGPSYNIVIHVRDHIEDIPEPERVSEFETLLRRMVNEK